MYCRYVITNASSELIKEATRVIRQMGGAVMDNSFSLVGIIYHNDDKKFLKNIHVVDHVIDAHRLNQLKALPF